MFADLVFTRDDRPLLRIWNYTQRDLDDLVKKFRRLAAGEIREATLRLSKSTFGVDQAVFRSSLEYRGARIQPSINAVVWELDPGGWQSVEQLALQVQPGSSRFQWLDDVGEVSVLLSPSGRW